MIRTYNGEAFRDRFMLPESKTINLLKSKFDRFLMIRLEELTRLMKPPIPPLRIDNHIIIYLTEGKATMTIGHDTHTIHPDECLAIPAGQVFSFPAVEPNRGYLCCFHSEFILGKFGTTDLLNSFAFIRAGNNPHICLDAQRGSFVEGLCHRIVVEYVAQGLTNLDLIQSYLIALLCELSAIHTPTPIQKQTSAAQITTRFQELLLSHYKRLHLVTDYASLLAITPNHLNKAIKASTGKSSTRWIDETIVLEAKVLLYQTDLSVAQIAIEMGINDASYFSRLFKKLEGITPLGFRKAIGRPK